MTVFHCTHIFYIHNIQSNISTEKHQLFLRVHLIIPLLVSCWRFLRFSQWPWLPVQRTHSIMRRPGSVWRSWPSISNLSATPEVQKKHLHVNFSLFCLLLRSVDTVAASRWNCLFKFMWPCKSLKISAWCCFCMSVSWKEKQSYKKSHLKVP